MVDHGLLPRSTSRFVDTVRGQRPCFYYRLLPVPLFFVRHEEVPYLGAGPLGQICESSCRYVAVFVLFSASRSWSGRSAIWVMLVKAAKKEAQAKAALLASVQAQQDEMILEASSHHRRARWRRIQRLPELARPREALGRHNPCRVRGRHAATRLSSRRRSQRGSPPHPI